MDANSPTDRIDALGLKKAVQPIVPTKEEIVMTTLARKVLQDADGMRASAALKASMAAERSDVLSYKKQDLLNSATSVGSASSSLASPPGARESSSRSGGGVGKQALKVVQRVATEGEEYDSIVDEEFAVESPRGADKAKPQQPAKRQQEAKEQPSEVYDDEILDFAPAVVADASSAAVAAQPWWDEVKQEWSYEAPPTDYVPVYYDPNQTYGTADAVAAAPANEQLIDDIADESSVAPTKTAAAVRTKVERTADGDDDDYGEDDFD